MFVTEVGALITTLEFFRATAHGESLGFVVQIALWLWFTVVFANFAEAMAEGRGKAQADALRKSRTKTSSANKLGPNGADTRRSPPRSSARATCSSSQANELIPADGEIIEGAATVNESAITGESAPVIREAGRRPLGGHRRHTVLSDQIKVRVTANPGESFMDRMIGLIEGAKRQKTPNEIALTILLSALTIIFLLVCITLMPFGTYIHELRRRRMSARAPSRSPCSSRCSSASSPPPSAACSRAIGIAGIDRMVQKNVLAMSGKAVEAAGDVDVLLLDKTGTITHGQPPGRRVLPGARRRRRGTRRRGAALVARRRNARRPQHRRPGRRSVRHPRPRQSTTCPGASSSPSPRRPA